MNVKRVLQVTIILTGIVEVLITYYNVQYIKGYDTTKMPSKEKYTTLVRIGVGKVDVGFRFTKALFGVLALQYTHVLWEAFPKSYIFLTIAFGIQFLIVYYPFNYLKTKYLPRKYPEVTFSSQASSFPPQNLRDYIFFHVVIYAIESLLFKYTCLLKRWNDDEINSDSEEYEEEEDIENILTIDKPVGDEELLRKTPRKRHEGILTRYYWIIHFGLIMSFVFITAIIVPLQMENSMGQFSQLKDDTLNDLMRRMMRTVNFPGEHIYHTDDPMYGPNAFVLGILHKRVVVTDELLKMMSPDMIAAVLGHEIGHWYNSDLIAGNFLALLPFFIMSLVVQAIADRGLKSLGFIDEVPAPVIVFISLIIYYQTQVVFTPIRNTITRTFERRADCFSASFDLPIGAALDILSNISEYAHPSGPLYRFFYSSHPLIAERNTNLRYCPKVIRPV